MTNIRAQISRGVHKGTHLFPHKHADEKYVATTSRFEEDYVRVDSVDELKALIESGFGARMSNPETGNAPSFIINKNIQLEESEHARPTAEILKSASHEVDLDGDSRSKYRKEQSLLRAYLLSGKDSGSCAICHHKFPFDMLVAAHLKKRSECSVSEKRDISNIAALMCKTGCDDLYEQGYLSVRDGEVVKTKKKVTSAKVIEVLSQVTGNRVENWEGSSAYYQWHHSKFNRVAGGI